MLRNLLRRGVVPAVVLALASSGTSLLPALPIAPAAAAAPPAADTIATGSYSSPALLALRSGTALATTQGSTAMAASYRRAGGTWSAPVDPAVSLRTGNYSVSVGNPVASGASDAVLPVVRQAYNSPLGLWPSALHADQTSASGRACRGSPLKASSVRCSWDAIRSMSSIAITSRQRSLSRWPDFEASCGGGYGSS